MAFAFDAERHGRPTIQNGAPPRGTPTPTRARVGQSRQPNTISASQARAARQRDRRRDELAVSAWLRELSSRPR